VAPSGRARGARHANGRAPQPRVVQRQAAPERAPAVHKKGLQRFIRKGSSGSEQKGLQRFRALQRGGGASERDTTLEDSGALVGGWPGGARLSTFAIKRLSTFACQHLTLSGRAGRTGRRCPRGRCLSSRARPRLPAHQVRRGGAARSETCTGLGRDARPICTGEGRVVRFVREMGELSDLYGRWESCPICTGDGRG
jgi:hypothetical protein